MQQDTSRPATGYPAPPFHHPNGGQPPPPPAAYPYAAPHPQYYHPPPPPPQRPYASRSFFRAFFATMICLAVIFGVILVITWLVLRPSLPHFTLTTLSLTNLNSTSPPSNSQSLSATWHLSFLVRNGNRKMTVTYNALRSSIFYHSNYLAESQLAPFKQDTKSEATLNATLSAANAWLRPLRRPGIGLRLVSLRFVEVQDACAQGSLPESLRRRLVELLLRPIGRWTQGMPGLDLK